MTRRIAISILLTVWLVLILAGTLTYCVTRSLLVADLDATLLARASSLPQIERPDSVPSVAVDARDRVLIRNPQGQLERPETLPPPDGSAKIPAPQIIERRFSTLPGGPRIRTITIKAFARRTAPNQPLVPVTILYSSPADRLDTLLQRLLFSLGAFGLLAGLATAGVAVIVAKTALRPLRATADVISAIGERNLDRRLDLQRLPPELHPVAARLNELLARLEVAFDQRRQFLADASHELRTPVAALLTTLEVTLRKPRPADEYAQALDTCLTDARLLHQLVATLMDQVRCEQFSAGAAPAESAPVPLGALLQHCAAMAGALGKRRGIDLCTDIPEAITILGDELKIRSMVMNLLSNAVEYTPAGGHVTLTLELLCPLETDAAASMADGDSPSDTAGLPDSLAAEKVHVQITVADTGPGILPQHLPHLFQPFYRADKARSESGNHLGLGLFLVQNHVRALGGSCRVESAPGKGARFLLEWPAVCLRDAPRPNTEPALAATAELEQTHG